MFYPDFLLFYSNSLYIYDSVISFVDKLTVSYTRSSGPGGQNVNKVNTKAEVRFHIDSADWLPAEAKQKLPIRLFTFNFDQ